MNDEIKEILDRLECDKDDVYYVGYTDGVNIDNTLMSNDIKLLLDYITNLQQKYDKALEDSVKESHKRMELENTLQKIMVSDGEKTAPVLDLIKENERLKELVNPKTQIFIDTQDMEERYGEELYKEYLEKQVKDYKSRCEKADEKIKKHLYDKKFLNNTHTDEQMLKIVSNILNGEE